MITKIMKKFWDKNEDGCIMFSAFFIFGIILGLFLLFFDLPTQIPLWTILVGGFVLVEIIYWLTPIEKVKKKSRKKNDTFKKALKLKVSCILDVLCFIGLTQLLYSGIKRIDLEEILDILIVIGLTIVCIIGLAAVLGIFYLWIKLNERKFKK